MANLSASGTAAVANDALLAKPFGATSASLSTFATTLAFATALSFALASFTCTSLEMWSKEASAKLPLLQKLSNLAVIGANSDGNILVNDCVHGAVVSHIDTVRVSKVAFQLFFLDVVIIEAFWKQEQGVVEVYFRFVVIAIVGQTAETTEVLFIVCSSVSSEGILYEGT